MLDTLKKHLESNEAIHQWMVTERRIDSTELYIRLGQREALREAEELVYDVTLFTLNHTQNGPAMGSMKLKVSPGESHLKDRIAFAVECARLQENPPFSLPAPGAAYPDFNDCDTQIMNYPYRVLNDLEERLHSALKEEQNITLSNSEFFLKRIRSRLINSRGLDLYREATDILWDVVFLFSSGSTETEFWDIYHRAGLRYFHLESDVHRFAKFARDAARAEVPRKGKCPVVLTGDALQTLFLYFVFHSSAEAKFQGAALFEPGRPVFPDTPEGDMLTLFSNAVLPGGTTTYRFDPYGLPGKRVCIIEDGILKRFWASKPYDEYIHVPPTGRFATIEIPPGSVAWKDLFASTDRVILVIQFSTFDPQPVTGNFLGEIRMGYEYRSDGSVIPLQGGSVTGDVTSGMSNCHFSRETALFQGYFGPQGVRFEKARVAGK